MEHLNAKAAAERLAEWSAAVGDHPGQYVNHVLTPFTGNNGFFNGTPAYNRWLAGGPDAVGEAIELYAQAAQSFPYVVAARTWPKLGNGNTRVVIHPRSALAQPWSWQNFANTVQWPVLTELCDEEILLLTVEQCQAAGMPLYGYDVNIWGDRGTMRTGYRIGRKPGVNTRDSWREFAAWTSDPLSASADHGYVTCVVSFARLEGQLIRAASLPAMTA